MYVTSPLSRYKKFPSSLSTVPEGPNSGYLVIQDEESETYSCFGLCKDRYLKVLPFSQNKRLTTRYGQRSGEFRNEVIIIPVLNQPLSANPYCALKPGGRHMVSCCFSLDPVDVQPMPLDPNMYEQLEIVPQSEKYCFYAKSIACDGFAPSSLCRKGWNIYTKTPKNYKLDNDATGVDSVQRTRLPELISHCHVKVLKLLLWVNGTVLTFSSEKDEGSG